MAKPIPTPMQAARFGEVANLLRNGDPAKGFTRAAEICLESFEVLSAKMQPYAVLKLAIELHKHGLFCEVAQDKAKTQHDAEAYAAYQQYLAGTSDTPVAVGLPVVGAASNAEVDLPDAEEADDEQSDRN